MLIVCIYIHFIHSIMFFCLHFSWVEFWVNCFHLPTMICLVSFARIPLFTAKTGANFIPWCYVIIHRLFLWGATISGAAAVKHIQPCLHQEIQAEYSPGKVSSPCGGSPFGGKTLSNGHPRFVIRYEVVRVYTVTVLSPVNTKKEHLNPTSIPVSMVPYTFWILGDTLYWKLILWDKNPE